MNTNTLCDNPSWKQFTPLLVARGGWLLLLCLAAGQGGAQTHWIVHDFAGEEGRWPGNLLLSGPTLYGTTGSGGSSNCGTVFKLETDGSGFTVLKEFAGSDGAGPGPGGLVVSGTTLYGTTGSGGSSNCGTVFKLETDGTGFAVLKQFAGSDGADPSGLLLSGTTLYGTTHNGGIGLCSLLL
jgi:uncharacterized repeat protein (TIGR03803 family)